MEIIIKPITPSYKQDNLQKQVDSLFKQLSNDKETKNLNAIFEESPHSFIIGAFDKELLIGMACMATYTVISSKKAWIEDVVVDISYRGLGLGEKLMKELINRAKSMNCTDIMLYTESEKEAANGLYLKLGFNKRTSSLYQYKL